MKPVYLEFCGINSFSEPAKINFTELMQFGIFGIFGDTGSGKSTILDCIGFALYGSVLRARSGVISDIINDRVDKAYVIFEFEIVFEGKRRQFRAERELKRKNASQSVRVYERIDGVWKSRADSVREANALLQRIIGLEQRDFDKCIALPQGEFSQFVKSGRADRLRLIARLFDLEQYGDSLVKRANARHSALLGEVNVLKARLEPYAEVSAEAIALLEAEIARLEGEEVSSTTALYAAREREKTLSALTEKHRDAERYAREMELLNARKQEMKALNDELSRLALAGSIASLSQESKQAEVRAQRAEEALSSARKQLDGAQLRAAQITPLNGEEDAEISRLTELKARAQGAEEIRERKSSASKKLEAALRESGEIARELGDFSYEAERAAIQARLEELGDGDFLSYVESRGKAALFRGEYAEFAQELEDLTQRHQNIAADTAPLIEKYASLATGDGLDFSALRAEFEARERERKQVQGELVALERVQGRHALRTQRLQQLQTDIQALKGEIALCGEKLGDVPALAEVSRQLEQKKAEKRAREEEISRANTQLSEARVALASAEEKQKGAAEAVSDAKKRCLSALEAGGFQTVEEALALSEKYGDATLAKARVEEYRERYAAVHARCRELAGEDFSALEGDALQEAKRQLIAVEERARDISGKLVLHRAELLRAQRELTAKRALETEYDAKRHEAEIAERLKKLIDNNKFMEFVAEEFLQTIALNASQRLLTLTDGRYFLRYDEGFLIGDNFNAGGTRGVNTLSGGEIFLVSLSLALSLSEEICLKSLRPIEFFFLDEGFGTLDGHLVDTVMDSLEKLKGEHFSIGIISHVEELKHRIDRKLSVNKATEKRGSQIIAE